MMMIKMMNNVMQQKRLFSMPWASANLGAGDAAYRPTRGGGIGQSGRSPISTIVYTVSFSTQPR